MKEYWVVYPAVGSISQFVLDPGGRYQVKKSYSFIDNIESTAISRLVILLDDIFPKFLQVEDIEYERASEGTRNLKDHYNGQTIDFCDKR